MDDYKKQLKTRMTIYCFLTAFCAALELLIQYLYHTLEDPTSFQGFLYGMISALLALTTVILASRIVSDSMLFHNEGKLQQQYNLEHDERRQLIGMKSAAVPLKACAFTFLSAGIVIAFFNEPVFFTLLGCCLFCLLLHKGLKLYYSKKY